MNTRRKMLIYINLNSVIFCTANLISFLNNEITLAYLLFSCGALGLFFIASIFTYKYLTLLNHLIIFIQSNSIEITTGGQEAYN